MEKLFKQGKRVFLLLAGLVSVLFLIVIFGGSIYQSWQMASYEHPTQIQGFKIGDSKRDIVFYGAVTMSDDGKFGSLEGPLRSLHFHFGDSEVVEQIDISPKLGGSFVPIRSVQNLIKKFGQPQIFAESVDLRSRLYTYSSDGLNNGVTYKYKDNLLTNVMFGKIEWRHTERVGNYEINGTRYCPGQACPFTPAGGLKLQWQNKTVKDLAAKYE